jgi:CRISP-associated protein Cas1
MQLIINTFGTSLRRKGDRFIIKAGNKQVAFSAQKVQSIVIATGAHFSSDAIHLATQHNVDVVFLDKRGDPTARVWQTKMGSTAAISRRKLEVAETAEAMNFVRQWTLSKVNNQLDFLKELHRRRPGTESVMRMRLSSRTRVRSGPMSHIGPV